MKPMILDIGNRSGGQRCSLLGKLGHLIIVASITIGVAVGSVTSVASAEQLTDRANAGKPIRIGYNNARPWCYQHKDGSLGGFGPTIAKGVLNSMGYTNVKSVMISNFGNLIPSLMAGQFDIAACGLYIMHVRCQNVAFADPFGKISDVFIVPSGNPRKIKTWKDVIKTGAKVAYIAGTNSVNLAHDAGVPMSQMMAVPSKAEFTSALLSGRVSVGAENLWQGREIVRLNSDRLQLQDMPSSKPQWPSTAFRPSDSDFLQKYNAAQAKYLGSKKMMASVADDGFVKSNLPAKNLTAAKVCQMR